MNYIAREILFSLSTDSNIAEDILLHYGTKRHSGRYPWGSGDNPYQHEVNFLNKVRSLRAKGYSEIQIANKCGFETTSQLRGAITFAKNDINSYRLNWGKQLMADGLSQTEAARRMGISESTFRSLLNEQRQSRLNLANETASYLKDVVDAKGPVDIGRNVCYELGVSEGKLNQAVDILKSQGYEVYIGSMPQVTNEHGQRTTLKVLCPPGTKKNAPYNSENISSVIDYEAETGKSLVDNGNRIATFQYPASMDSKRIKFRYLEDGGGDKDGLIEIRPGVKDLSLGKSTYAQIRVLVDGNKYIKGMACYSNDIPEGYDMIVNSHYPKASGKALKPIKEDPANPFGSLIKANGQSYWTDDDGKEHLSLINKRAEEGDWNDWSKSLPSQFLSKQNKKLIKTQLDLSISEKMDEYNDIMKLTNPTVKRYFLEKFAEDCDTTSVHLNAAALPRQRYQVIIPISSLKNTEIYAPNFKQGEQVALIRYPHGGIFEIPILTVNNKNREGAAYLGKSPMDAVGINAHVAQQLSGADFDGDTVMVIPMPPNMKISSRPYLDQLKGFDPQMAYPKRDGMTPMKRTDIEMGKITNLIMDMTLAGAPDDEVAMAIKHSMVVIDAKKHELDWKRSEQENHISELKKRYQTHTDANGNQHSGGSSTIVTLAKSPFRVTKRRGEFSVDEETGKKVWKEAFDAHYIDRKTGKEKTRTQDSYKMLETDDPYSLVSELQHPQELLYADYASKLKALANEARKQYAYEVPNLVYSPSANKVYQDEVRSLTEQLKNAKLNAPREREAQRRANVRMAAREEDNPTLQADKKERGKAAQQELTKARYEVGAQRYQVKISPREWEAIQAGAVHDSFLQELLKVTDIDVVRSYATPKSNGSLSRPKINRLYSLQRSGYTNQEIADALNVPVSTVLYYLKTK